MRSKFPGSLGSKVSWRNSGKKYDLSFAGKD